MQDKIIEMYRELPEQQRTSGIVADRLQAQGYSVDASRVREILEEAVLADVDGEAIRTAGRVLRMLVDVHETSERRACEFDKDDPFYNPLDYGFVEKLLGGLRRRHPMELDVLTEAVAHLLDSYMAHRAQQSLECTLKLEQPAGRMSSEPGALASRNTDMDHERDSDNTDKVGAEATHDDDDVTEQMRNMRPITRPFTADELSEVIQELRNIDLTNAEVTWWYAEFCDPYCIADVPHVQVGREYFVRASGGSWVWFGDLPPDLRDSLWKGHHHALAFPAGLPIFE